MFLNDEPTNVLISLFVTNNRLRIDYARKEHSLKRKKSFNNDQQTTANSAIKKKKSGDCRRFKISKIIKRTKYRIRVYRYILYAS